MVTTSISEANSNNLSGLENLFVGAYGIKYDGKTNLHYMRYRWYSNDLQRFISPDLLLGINRYVYCDENPINLVDIFGLEEVIIYDSNFEGESDWTLNKKKEHWKNHLTWSPSDIRKKPKNQLSKHHKQVKKALHDIYLKTPKSKTWFSEYVECTTYRDKVENEIITGNLPQAVGDCKIDYFIVQDQKSPNNPVHGLIYLRFEFKDEIVWWRTESNYIKYNIVGIPIMGNYQSYEVLFAATIPPKPSDVPPPIPVPQK